MTVELKETLVEWATVSGVAHSRGAGFQASTAKTVIARAHG
jgi:hypothetical protein